MEKGKNKVGDYTALDGQWRDGLPHGLEDKGLVQDVRMNDNDLFLGQEEFDIMLELANGNSFMQE